VQCQRRGASARTSMPVRVRGSRCIRLRPWRVRSAGPGGESGGPAGALHSVVTLVLLVVAVWPAGAHGRQWRGQRCGIASAGFSGRVPRHGPGHLRSADG
jgi:hypothetical protein